MAENRSFEGELTKAISGSLVVARIVVMAVAIAIASVAMYGFEALGNLIKTAPTGKSVWGPQSLFWIKYTIRGIGWILAAYVVLSGMVAVCKMAAARESGQSRSLVAGIMDVFLNLFGVFFATLRYLVWFAALLILLWGLGFVGRIPGFGPIITGAALAVVMLVLALWIALHIAKFFGAALVLPAIIASSGQKGVVCFKEAKRIVHGQPVALVKRFLAIGLAILLFSFAVCQGVTFLANHGGSALGEQAPVLNGAPPMKVIPKLPVYTALPVVQVQRMWALGTGAADKTRLAGAWIFGIELLIVLLIIKAAAANFFALAGMATYRELKDAAPAPISGPDIKVDLSKVKGSLGAVGAKFKEQMKDDEPASKKDQG